jgi:phenylacetate-CoA ligase
LKKVTGRTVDLFKTADGRQIDGEYFTHLLYFKDWVTKFQFVQKSVNLIEVRIVSNQSTPKQELQNIKEKIRLIMGNSCDVKIVLKDQILPPKSGKFRYTISEIA